MARNEAFGHKLPLSPSDYERMTALLALNLSPRGLRNAALLAVWYDSLLRIEDCCGLSVGLVAGKSSFRVVQGKVSIASALTGKRRKRGVVCYPHSIGTLRNYPTGPGKVIPPQAIQPQFQSTPTNQRLAAFDRVDP
jgi:hypothetical protein